MDYRKTVSHRDTVFFILSIMIEESFCILDKEIIQIFVTTIKTYEIGILSEFHQFHRLYANGNVFFRLLYRLS